MAITLQESLRAVFYAPFYAALARGAFDAEGVEIEFASAPRPGDAAKRLMEGAVDVCWGGPMRVNETYHQMPGCDIVCFGEVVGRDPFLLMGRRPPRDGFTLADLKSVKLATVSEVPTPWLCLQHDLRLAGIDPASISRVTDQTMARNVEALKAGEVDVVQVFEPFPSLLLADKAAHVWYEAARRGPTSYTTFYARRGTLTARRDELTRMVRAIAATETWVAGASGAAIARAIARYFADLPMTILEAACSRYKTLGIWNADPILPRESYDRLRDSLVSGGFVSPGVPFETAVDNSLADGILKA
ncbi:MAG: ABC transporter substrate-binding protein [Reyranella sp.]|uniref:ABC transporter substrate-binding protein n=1 Tax=Reyranella sp. TaxID=1929291 RepID=UPI001ACA7A55|nr:ABC transporter substrate-binding protein [Reyranella sp.]MBN9089065.1 ABC transporter substrate-binding protein [Reyranella sp.]